MPFVINHSRKQNHILRPRYKIVAKGVTALCLLRLNLLLTQLTRKSETARAKMLPFARCREKPNAEPKANVGFLSPLTTFSFISLKEKV